MYFNVAAIAAAVLTLGASAVSANYASLDPLGDLIRRDLHVARSQFGSAGSSVDALPSGYYSKRDLELLLKRGGSRSSSPKPSTPKSGGSKPPSRKNSGSGSNAQAASGMLNQYNQLQQQTMTENMEMQKAQAFWNPLESMSKKDATS